MLSAAETAVEGEEPERPEPPPTPETQEEHAAESDEDHVARMVAAADNAVAEAEGAAA